MNQVQIIKTHYPHWGAHTAFNKIGTFLHSKDIKTRILNVPMGEHWFCAPWLKKKVFKKIKSKGVAVYQLNDYVAETLTLAGISLLKTDIVHYFDGEHTLMFLPDWIQKYKFVRPKPAIVAMFHQPPEALSQLINLEIVKKVDCVMVVSPTQANYFTGILPPERIKIVPLGVDTDYFVPNGKPKPHETFRCLSGGIWMRDYDSLLETARRLKEHSNIEFHIVSKKFDIPADLNNIFFHENISDSALLELYQTCHTLFLPFKDATANTFLMEGAACGLPVISSQLESIASYFPGDSSFLIKDNNAKEFADCILSLERDRKQLSIRSETARNRALELSWHNIAEEYKKIYKAIV